MRRPTTALFVALLASISFAQRRDGTYQETPWSINEHHALIWGGEPYLPAGLRIDGSPGAVNAAHEKGVKDLLVDLPANGSGWKGTIEALEGHQQRYLIRFDSMAPMASGFAVEPQGYRVPGIDKPKTIEVSLPGATSAFVVLAAKRDESIQAKARVPVINGKLVYEAKPGPSFEHILLIYPEMASAEQPDYWEGFDYHRDTLLNTLKQNPLGSGFRGIVNPVGRMVTLPGREVQFVPTSALFQMEMRNYLEQKYKSVQTATRSLAISASDLSTFEEIARLVPLWSGNRGVAQLLDPKTNKLYPSSRQSSKIWSDINTVVHAAGIKRYSRLVDAIRSVADVPVVQEWSGWALPYETASPQIDGIGMKSFGSMPSQIVESASRATSSILRWKSNGWLVATDIQLGGTDSAQQLPLVVNDLTGLGARGFFVRTEDPALIGAVAQLVTSPVMAQNSPSAVFYPENATNPANPQRLTGGYWWLPSPVAGNRIDLGTQFFGYRTENETALWAKTPGRYKLRLADPKAAVFKSVDGSDPDPKVVKNGVEVNLSEIPLLVSGTNEIPIPEGAFNESVKQFDDMMGVAETQHRDIISERLMFQTYVKGFETNPGASFPLLRQQVYALAYKISSYIWLEAERPRETNFSEISSVPGASNLGALILDTKIDPGVAGYFANYQVPVRSGAEQEVWIAAKIPSERRGDVQVLVADQILELPDEPTVQYGQGLGWYKLGTTVLTGNMSNLKIMVNSGGAPIAIDVILLSPVPFHPIATYPPLPPPMPKK